MSILQLDWIQFFYFLDRVVLLLLSLVDDVLDCAIREFPFHFSFNILHHFLLEPMRSLNFRSRKKPLTNIMINIPNLAFIDAKQILKIFSSFLYILAVIKQMLDILFVSSTLINKCHFNAFGFHYIVIRKPLLKESHKQDRHISSR